MTKTIKNKTYQIITEDVTGEATQKKSGILKVFTLKLGKTYFTYEETINNGRLKKIPNCLLSII